MLFRYDLTAAFEGVLPGEHGLIGFLSGIPFGQFGGSHVAVGDVMPITGGGFLIRGMSLLPATDHPFVHPSTAPEKGLRDVNERG